MIFMASEKKIGKPAGRGSRKTTGGGLSGLTQAIGNFCRRWQRRLTNHEDHRHPCTKSERLPRNTGDWHRNRGSTAMVTGVAVYDCRDTPQQTLPKSSTKHRNILN